MDNFFPSAYLEIIVFFSEKFVFNPEKQHCFKMGGSLKWLIISVMTHNVLGFYCQQFFFLRSSRYPFSDNDSLQFWCANFLSIAQTKLELSVEVVKTAEQVLDLYPPLMQAPTDTRTHQPDWLEENGLL